MNNKTIQKFILSLAVICSFFSPMFLRNAHAASYTIEFKAGAHGTIQNEKAVSYHINNGDVFPDEPIVQAKSGYVFKGWNKELPEVGSVVNGKEVYVAKYGVVINGMNYTIRYVDENKVDIATPQTMLGEQGEQYVARAKTIAGYTYQVGQQNFTLDKNNQQVFITYTLTNPDLVIREEISFEEVVSETTENNNTENTPENSETTPEVDIEDNEQPKTDGPEVDIDDNVQPKANGEQAGTTLLIVSIGGALLIATLGFIFYKKKKHRHVK